VGDFIFPRSIVLHFARYPSHFAHEQLLVFLNALKLTITGQVNFDGLFVFVKLYEVLA
jgi:hypothetical protein